MRKLLTSVAIAVSATLAVLLNSKAENQPKKPVFLNVKDFGAVGDGKTDDTEAIQKALNAAGFPKYKPLSIATSTVVFPPGHYKITKPLKVTPRKRLSLLTVKGSGGVESYGALPSESEGLSKSTTQIFWGADTDGIVFDVWGCGGLIFSNMTLSGNDKNVTLLRINSPPGWGAGRFTLYNVAFVNGTTGVLCGDDSRINSADLSFYDCVWTDLNTGFQTDNCQNLDYAFTRPYFKNCKLGFYFHQGGLVYAAMPTFIRCRRAIQIDHGGTNVGSYVFDMLHMEQAPLQVLNSTAGATVTFTGLSVQTTNKINPVPLFDISGYTNVKVIGSNITRTPVAKIAKKAFIQFDTCRFAGAPQQTDKSYDPRRPDVISFSGDYASCEVVSSFIGSTFVKKWGKYRVPPKAKKTANPPKPKPAPKTSDTEAKSKPEAK